MFIDEVQIKVSSGKWGDWLVSWRREKYIPKGWPWGWDGWKWGDVYLQTDENLNTLSDYRHKKVLSAEKWENWWTNTKHWANWEDLIVKVPVWTIVKNPETMEIIVDLDKNNMKYLICMWWRWGFGNAHFCSSTRQAPAFAELWDWVEEKDLHLELKLVADIWIIGVPSAWKSTLIWNITNVKPKIWDYPFTTLTPNLWVLDYKWKSLVLEDVPGLIPWAHEWKGLWIEFLKHIERTWVLLHLLDMYRMDQVFEDYKNIRKELEFFSEDLAKKEELIVFSKADLLDEEMKDFIVSEFKKKYKKDNIFIISAATWEGIEELKDYLVDNYTTALKQEEVIEDRDDTSKLKVYNLKESSDNLKKVKVDYLWELRFQAKWDRLEQIVRMTDFENKEAVMRVYDVLDKMWVIKDIEKKLEKIMEEQNIDNSFFFEWSEDENITPKIIIGHKEIDLDKLKYNL